MLHNNNNNKHDVSAVTADTSWKVAGLYCISIRFVQGWIFWGGGSRRFIYAPEKLDPNAAEWMANKLQSAMPGALFGVEHLISFLLQHFYLLYLSIILFSLVELITGMALILGFFTRLAGFISALLSISLMIIFGWEGSTCLDEWTMAVSNLAMGLTIALAGSSYFSLDGLLLKKHPTWLDKPWFTIFSSGPLPTRLVKWLAAIFIIFTIIFTLGTYNYYRGAIFSWYHAAPVSAVQYHLSLSEGSVLTNGAIQFDIFVDAGNSAIPDYVMKIELWQQAPQQLIKTWGAAELSQLPKTNIVNQYAYNRVRTGPYGLIIPVSAKASILLPSIKPAVLKDNTYQLKLYTISGSIYNLDLANAR